MGGEAPLTPLAAVATPSRRTLALAGLQAVGLAREGDRMSTTILHASFTVSDTDRSLAFYGDLLGMQVVSDQVYDSDDPWLPEFSGFTD